MEALPELVKLSIRILRSPGDAREICQKTNSQKKNLKISGVPPEKKSQNLKISKNRVPGGPRGGRQRDLPQILECQCPSATTI